MRALRVDMQQQRGFSLLEILVAFVILAFAMSAIYQSAGNSVQATIVDEQRAYALILAQSVLDNYSSIPPGGMQVSGKLENGYGWSFQASSMPPSASEQKVFWPMYAVTVSVHWGNSDQAVELHSVLPEGRSANNRAAS